MKVSNSSNAYKFIYLVRGCTWLSINLRKKSLKLILYRINVMFSGNYKILSVNKWSDALGSSVYINVWWVEWGTSSIGSHV